MGECELAVPYYSHIAHCEPGEFCNDPQSMVRRIGI